MSLLLQKTTAKEPALLQRMARSRLSDVAPVFAFGVYGAIWIASHASARSSIHTLFQSLALAEAIIALLLRRAKPSGLAGIAAAYLLFQLDAVLLPALVLALLAVAMHRSTRTTIIGAAACVLVVVAVPVLGKRAPIHFATYVLPRVIAIVVAAAAGIVLRTRGRSSPQALRAMLVRSDDHERGSAAIVRPVAADHSEAMPRNRR